jgi:dTDP-4-dehydrorhamnose 3,5-epimerase
VKIESLALPGAYLITAQRVADERGHFARLWCRDTFAQAGLRISIEQASLSFNHRAGTLRGMHFSAPPSQEGKLVRCARGRAFDVMLDLRPDLPTFGQHLGFELDADAGNAVFIPPGVAHGFQTLVDATEMHYMMSENYQPAAADGVRFDDPAFGIRWPLPVSCIAERDRGYPDFDAAAHWARCAVPLRNAGGRS